MRLNDSTYKIYRTSSANLLNLVTKNLQKGGFIKKGTN